ncbi:unnamed protein product [Darwinula stevensoni]|uniref:C2H2-type domain-containing protein n=1 Tax=Darwinula stevensoni TaxID=69355 RepID=A0A7R8XCF6_9CRUS|nr:unnamed protein product [Darwinula stevensoni]CAG0893699.1 unnamed protein product [Darwinula stevensoni]
MTSRSRASKREPPRAPRDEYEEVFAEITTKLYGEPVKKIARDVKTEDEGEEGEDMLVDRNSDDRPASPDLSHSKLLNGTEVQVGDVLLPELAGLLRRNRVLHSGENWFENEHTLPWTTSKIAQFHCGQKVFRCIECQAFVGLLMRVAEHWLGTHTDLKAFQCPHCPYDSAWYRCVRMHFNRAHDPNWNLPETDMWKASGVLSSVSSYLQRLKSIVESHVTTGSPSSPDGSGPNAAGKRYWCSYCPYATDRRDLYTRHENIHKEEKPFHCYVCFKQFNRADHVKKHFLRIHRDLDYDTTKIRRDPNALPLSIGVEPEDLSAAEGGGSNSSGSLVVTPKVPVKTSKIPSSKMRIKEDKSHRSTKVVPSKIKQEPVSQSEEEAKAGDEGGTSGKDKEGTKLWCHMCAWTGTDSWSLKRHIYTHTKPFMCPLCLYRASRRERLLVHVGRVHDKRICTRCNLLADSQLEIDIHIQREHKNSKRSTNHLCLECGKVFPSQLDFEMHAVMAHPRATASAKCDTCDFSAEDTSQLELHRREVHGNNPDGEALSCSCSGCGCTFTDEVSLRSHMDAEHKGEAVAPIPLFNCTLCPFSCSTQNLMMEHMRIHSGQALECLAEECTFTTPFSAVLKDHITKTHTGDMKYVIRCLHCGLRISTLDSFLTHNRTCHHPDRGEDEFGCPLCTKVLRLHFGLRDALPTSLELYKQTGTVLESLFGDVPADSGQMEIRVTLTRSSRRSRKQSTPKKVSVANIQVVPDLKPLPIASALGQRSHRSRRRFRCGRCDPGQRRPVSYARRPGLLLHRFWFHAPKCKRCDKRFRYWCESGRHECKRKKP